MLIMYITKQKANNVYIPDDLMGVCVGGGGGGGGESSISLQLIY